ncbi:MAG: hypothetical protein M1818_003165 [Claussenomyces sp. TS43310]|nr:MAG: hypothetical protein M1818_003165 [Claussenomyces sp. TS43310]
MSVLGSSTLFTADEKNIEAMLATQFNDFGLGPDRRGSFRPLLGNGIFTEDGEQWIHSRSLLRPQFARDQVSDLDREEGHVQNMMLALPTDASKWTTEVDLSALFFRLTLDSACEFLFGESVDSQLAGLSTQSRPNSPFGNDSGFGCAFDKGQADVAIRLRFRSKGWLVYPPGFRKACQQCHDFIDHFVAIALSKDLERGLEGSEKKRKYVFLEALATQTQDPLELRSQLLNILLAGRDTTASLLGWMFYSLARDHTRYAKLRAIVLSEFGPYSSNPFETVTFSKLKSCRYLQHCLNESLRLHPAVPLNARQANKDTTLPRGGGPDGQNPIFVPAGTVVDYSVYVLHHRRDIWGEDADEFKPERWEGRKSGWEYLPVSKVQLFPNI